MITIPTWTIFVYIGILAVACFTCWKVGYDGGREDASKA